MSSTTCPVFNPTLEEFCNFKKYISHIEHSVDDPGIAKIIPPEGWFERSYTDLINDPKFKIKSPSRQHIDGSNGVYKVFMMTKNDISITQYREVCNKNTYTSDSLEDRERKFWKTITTGEAPWYGADMEGTLFGTDPASSWNIDKLDNPLKLIKLHLPGVTSGMLYFGSWKSMFAYHTEDMDLYSINYLHYGEAKSWYSVPVSQRKRFESLACSYFPSDYNLCHEFLRHKTSMISPNKLKEHAIRYNTAVQHAGEFIITFPGSYHSGFNHGFNIAEATNFATCKWLPFGRKAKYCKCEPDSVNIDMSYFETLMDREMVRKLKECQSSKLSYHETQEVIGGSVSDIECKVDDVEDRDYCLERTDWILRCACDRRVVFSRNNQSAVAEGTLFQCRDCHAWCHVRCIFPPENSKSTNDAEIKVPTHAVCHTCQMINNTLQNEKKTATRRKYVRKQKDVTSNKKQKIHSHATSPPPPSLHPRSPLGVTEREEEEGEDQEVWDCVKVGDKIHLLFSATNSLNAIGEAVEVKEDKFRFHCQHISQDIWISIMDLDSYYIIRDEEDSKTDNKKEVSSSLDDQHRRGNYDENEQHDEMKIDEPQAIAHTTSSIPSQQDADSEAGGDGPRPFDAHWFPPEWEGFVTFGPARHFYTNGGDAASATSAERGPTKMPYMATVKYWQNYAITCACLSLTSPPSTTEDFEKLLELYLSAVQDLGGVVTSDVGKKLVLNLQPSDLYRKYCKIKQSFQRKYSPIWCRLIAELGEPINETNYKDVLLNVRKELWRIRDETRIVNQQRNSNKPDKSMESAIVINL